MSVTAERIAKIRVATTRDGVVLMMDGVKEDVKVILDLDGEMTVQLTLDLIAAGFGPSRSGGRA